MALTLPTFDKNSKSDRELFNVEDMNPDEIESLTEEESKAANSNQILKVIKLKKLNPLNGKPIVTRLDSGYYNDAGVRTAKTPGIRTYSTDGFTPTGAFETMVVKFIDKQEGKPQ